MGRSAPSVLRGSPDQPFTTSKVNISPTLSDQTELDTPAITSADWALA